MSEYYQIGQTVMKLRQTDSACDAVKTLENMLDEASIEGYGFDTKAEDGVIHVCFDLPGTFMGHGMVNAIDKAVARCGEHATEAFVMPYEFDGDKGIDVFGPGAEQLKLQYQARELAQSMSESGAPFPVAGLQPAFEGLLTNGCRKHCLLIGHYGDGQRYVGVIDVIPVQARDAIEDYLERLEQGEAPKPGWPDSADFEIDEIFDVSDLLGFIAQMKSVPESNADETNRNAA